MKVSELNIKTDEIDKILFECKEADCSSHCKLIHNVPIESQSYFKIDDNEVVFPTKCPYGIMPPIWKYKRVILVKQKIDEIVIHGHN